MPNISELRDTLTNLEVPDRGIDEPLSAPDLFDRKLRRFQDELFNLHPDSHLYRYLLALCGEGGAGSIKKEILYSKLQSAIASTHFHDLDRLYGYPLAFPRISAEIYNIDPKDEVLTEKEWTEVYAKDASYRNRCLLWMRAIIHGGSPTGIKLAAEAACGVECDLFAVADYLNDTRSDHPAGISNIGRTVSDGELVIVPRINSLTQAEQHRIIAMVDRIRPVDTLITVSLGSTVRTQKFPTSSAATSEFANVKRFVRGRSDITWPNVGRRPSRNILRNGGAEIGAITGWGTNNGTLTASTATTPYEGRWVFRSAADGAGAAYYYSDSFQGEVSGATAGRTFTGSVWVKGSGASIGKTVQVFVSEVGGAGGESTAGAITSSVVLSQGWQRVWGQKTFVSNDRTIARLYINYVGGGASEVFFFDGAQLEEQTTPTAYIATATTTNGGPVTATGVQNDGMWLVAGEEREAPTYAWISRQEAATFLDITQVNSSSEHFGDFSKIQRDLFPHLALQTDDQFFQFADEFSYTQAFSQIGISIPWMRNDKVLVNNYYPIDYLQNVDLTNFNVSPSHRFWASEEKVEATAVNILSAYHNTDAEDGIGSYWTDFGAVYQDGNYLLFGKKSFRYFREIGSGVGAMNIYMPGERIPVTAGTTYCASVFARGDGYTGATLRTINITLQWFNASDTNFASVSGAGFAEVSGDWTRVYVSGVAPAGAVACRIVVGPTVSINEIEFHYVNAWMLEAGVTTPSAYPQNEEWLVFDFGRNRPVNYVDFEISQKPVDISVEYLAESVNILESYDPGFENSIGRYPIYAADGKGWWYYFGDPTNGNITTTTDFAHSGKASAKVTIGNTATSTSQTQGIAFANAPIIAGQYYKFSAWVKGIEGRNMQLYFSQYGAFNAASPITNGAQGLFFTGDSDWQYVEFTVYALPGANYAYLYIFGANPYGPGVFYVDDVKLQVANPLTPTLTWTDVTPTDGTDYNYGISYVVSEQPWRFWRLYFDKVDTRQIRVKFDKRDDPFPFGNTDPFPWSVEVRNFRAVHLMQDADDFEGDTGTDIFGNAYRNVLSTYPSGLSIDGSSSTYWMSQPNPVPYAVEALYFDVSTTLHGISMTELDAGIGGGPNTMTTYDNISMSGMEAYVTGAGAQTIDEIYIDPVFSGSDMHFYWSTDPQPDWESKLWHPIPIHYKCTRGFHAFPYPVTARYFKVEFSNLTPLPYNTLDYPQLLPPTYRKFPSWVQNYFAALTPETIQNFLEEGQTITVDPYDFFKIQTDRLSTTRDQQVLPREEDPPDDTNEITDIVDEIVDTSENTTAMMEQQIRFFPPTIWRDDLKDVLDLSRAASRMIWQDEEDQYMLEEVPEILDAPDEQSAEDLSAERAQKTAPVMWFPRVCRHGYQVVTGPFQAKLAYQVAIREITFWYRGFVQAGDSEFGVSTYGGSTYG